MSTTNLELRDQTAVDYLNTTGMRPLDRAWTGTEGTVDAFYEDRGELVVIAITSSVYRLPWPRVQRLRRLAVAWLNEHGMRFDRIRVDIVSVKLLPMGQSNLEHIKAVDA